MITRRRLLGAGGLALVGLAAPPLPRPARAGAVVEIALRSDPLGAHVAFDPVGVLIEPGDTVRWNNEANVHTATAYHPDVGDRPLRIPEDARPWDSGYLVEPGDEFEVTLTVEGVYDYYCVPHEAAGMVGRIIVGRPAGPGARPFDYFADDPAARHWRPLPDAARAAFPAVEEIMRRRVVRPGA